MSENKKEKFSFSKLSCYGNCPKNYYLTYIEHVKRSQNTYGLLRHVISRFNRET